MNNQPLNNSDSFLIDLDDPCVICEQGIAANALHPSIWDKGNNATPVAEGQCCDSCNFFVVLPRRIAEIGDE
jgi:hypothetical protein